MGLLLCICVNTVHEYYSTGNEANRSLFCHSVSWLPLCFVFFFVCFPKKPYIYSANYNLLGIFAPGCVFRSTATVDLEFGSTLVLYHLEAIVITVCLEVALISCVHEQ